MCGRVLSIRALDLWNLLFTPGSINASVYLPSGLSAGPSFSPLLVRIWLIMVKYCGENSLGRLVSFCFIYVPAGLF